MLWQRALPDHSGLVIFLEAWLLLLGGLNIGELMDHSVSGIIMAAVLILSFGSILVSLNYTHLTLQNIYSV